MLKKWIIGILVVGMVVVAGAAYAFNPDGELPRTGAVDVWEWNGNAYVHIFDVTNPDPDAGAWCFALNSDLGICNKQLWTLNVTNHASVAQWIEWTISAKNWHWFVRKPGTYIADCITATIKSNYDVYVNYENFADLMYQDSGGVKQNIPTYYCLAGMTPPAQGDFIRAADLNNDDDLIVDSQELHDGSITWKLWNMIEVDECNSACEYHNAAIIYISLLGIKSWIDPLTGFFDLTRS